MLIETAVLLQLQLCSVVVQDNVVRVWMMDSESNVTCTAAGYGHTHTVMSVAFFRCVSFVCHMLVCNCNYVLSDFYPT